jgi:hypothetical protein
MILKNLIIFMMGTSASPVIKIKESQLKSLLEARASRGGVHLNPGYSGDIGRRLAI